MPRTTDPTSSQAGGSRRGRGRWLRRLLLAGALGLALLALLVARPVLHVARAWRADVAEARETPASRAQASRASRWPRSESPISTEPSKYSFQRRSTSALVSSSQKSSSG